MEGVGAATGAGEAGGIDVGAVFVAGAVVGAAALAAGAGVVCAWTGMLVRPIFNKAAPETKAAALAFDAKRKFSAERSARRLELLFNCETLP